MDMNNATNTAARTNDLKNLIEMAKADLKGRTPATNPVGYAQRVEYLASLERRMARLAA